MKLEKERSRVDAALEDIAKEIKQREQLIISLQSHQKEITSDRVSQTTIALTKVKLALTPSNIEALCYERILECEDILIAKGFCTLLRVNKDLGTADCYSTINSDEVYWQHFKSIIKDKAHFYHRLDHFFFNEEIVSAAASVRVEGLSKTCYECVKSEIDDRTPHALLHCIREWLNVIFESTTGYDKERKLLHLESEERSLLEKRKMDKEMLASSRRILRQEIEQTNTSIQFVENIIRELERKLQLSKVMKFLTKDGHTVLSWAAMSGNRAIVKQVLKNGAHTGITEDTMTLCAVMIQVFYRRHLLRKTLSRLPPELLFRLNSECLTMTMRISSLHRIIRRQLRRIRLPLVEALFNGHADIVNVLRGSENSGDLTMDQAINLASMFSIPGAASIPRTNVLTSSYAIELPNKDDAKRNNLVSMIIPCVHFQHNQNPNSCCFIDSLRSAIELVDGNLMRQTKVLETKIRLRRETILRKYRQISVVELNKAMRQQSFVDMVRISSRGGISLDHENQSGMTPLILAAIRDETQKQDLQLNHKPVSAVVYMLDRISPYKPTIGYESSLGRTALSAACAYGRLLTANELLDRGAQINQQTNDGGQSALMTACIAGKLDVVKMLISRGADVDLKDHSGLTALELASRNKHFDIVTYLKQLK